VIFAVLALSGLAAPGTLRPAYRAWMKLGLLMSRVTTPLIMGIVFFLVVTPMGIARRVLGKDSLARRFDDSPSYRVPSRKAPVRNMEKPF
jgi:hypothetical protein